jgi:tripartite ATP-independent transporter DctP family solute receptor
MIHENKMRSLGFKTTLCALAITAGSLFGAGTVIADTKKLTVTSLYSADKPQTKVWVKFGELLEEKLPGEFEVKIITDGALGGEKEEAEGILLGSIDGSLSTIANLTTWVSEGAIFDMPFLFRDQAHIDKVLDDSLGEDMKALYKEQGFTVLDYVTYGSRNVISKEPITGLADIQGKTMRVLPGELHVSLWKYLGANPTAIPITEAYSALETGVADYMDMTKSGYNALKLFEVAPYITETGHIWALGVMYFSNTYFDSLSDAQKTAFQEAASESTAYFTELAAAEQQLGLDATIAGGAKIVETDLSEWSGAMDGFWKSYADKVGGMERLRAVANTK